MKNIFKKIIILLVATFVVTGCNSSDNKINSNSQLANAKKTMMENLDNFSYDANITVKTGIIDVTTTMECKEDRKNQAGYCKTSTYGVQTERYVDYKRKIEYIKVSSFITNPSNGSWTKKDFKGSNTDNWLNLNDYIFNISEETKNGGIYYTGKINSRKLAAAITTMDSNIDMDSIVSDDIDITVFVNSSGYIEKMTFDMEIMGMNEYVEINYKNYNSSENITIPSEVNG